MKTFFLILVLLFAVETSHAAPKPTPEPTPLSESQREVVEHQRDQMVEGLLAKLIDANKQLQASQALHVTDQGVQSKLQETTNGMANTIQEQAVKITALEKSVNFWKRIVAVEAGLVALFLCLTFNVPKLATPYGLLATILAGPLAFGLCMLL